MEMELDTGPPGGIEVLQMPDVLSEVLAQLCSEGGPVELCRVARVSTAWKAASQDPKFWQTLKFKNRAIEDEQLLALVLRHSSHITSLHLARPAVARIDEVLHRALPLLHSLKDLAVDAGCRKAHDVLEAVMAHRTVLTQLRTLTLKGMYVDNALVGAAGHAHQHPHQHPPGGIPSLEVTLSHAQLEELQLKSSSFRRLSIQGCPAMERLTLHKCQVVNLVMDLPALQVLETQELSLQPRNAAAALCMLPSLSELSIRSSLTFNDEFMAVVCANLGGVQKLDVSHCKAVTLATVTGLNSLHVLHACGCDGIRDQQLSAAMSACWSLEEVYLDGSVGLVDVALAGLPALRVLSMRGCTSLQTVSIKCHQLRELGLGKVRQRSPTSASLHLVQLSSFSMQKISWADLPSLEKLQLDCPNLTHISLTDCDKLSEETISGWSNCKPLPVAPSLPAKQGSCGGLNSKPLDGDSDGLDRRTWRECKQASEDMPSVDEGDAQDGISDDSDDNDDDRPARGGAVRVAGSAARSGNAAPRTHAAATPTRGARGRASSRTVVLPEATSGQQAEHAAITRSLFLAMDRITTHSGTAAGSGANGSGSGASVPGVGSNATASAPAAPAAGSGLSAGSAPSNAASSRAATVAAAATLATMRAPARGTGTATATPADDSRAEPAGNQPRLRLALGGRRIEQPFIWHRPLPAAAAPAPGAAAAAPTGAAAGIAAAAGNAAPNDGGQAPAAAANGLARPEIVVLESSSEGEDNSQLPQSPASLRQTVRSTRPRRFPSSTGSGASVPGPTVLHGVRDSSGGIWPCDNMQPVTADGLRFDIHIQRDQQAMGSPSSSGARSSGARQAEQESGRLGGRFVGSRLTSSTSTGAGTSTQPNSLSGLPAGGGLGGSSGSAAAPSSTGGASGSGAADAAPRGSNGSSSQGGPSLDGAYLPSLPWKRGTERDSGYLAAGSSSGSDRDRKRRASAFMRAHRSFRGFPYGADEQPSPRPFGYPRSSIPHQYRQLSNGPTPSGQGGASSSMAQAPQGTTNLNPHGQPPIVSPHPLAQPPSGQASPGPAPQPPSDSLSPGALAASTLLSLAVTDANDAEAMCISPSEDLIWEEFPLPDHIPLPDSPEMAPAGPSPFNWLAPPPPLDLPPPTLYMNSQQPGSSGDASAQRQQSGEPSSPARRSSVFRSLADRLMSFSRPGGTTAPSVTGAQPSSSMQPPQPPAAATQAQHGGAGQPSGSISATVAALMSMAAPPVAGSSTGLPFSGLGSSQLSLGPAPNIPTGPASNQLSLSPAVISSTAPQPPPAMPSGGQGASGSGAGATAGGSPPLGSWADRPPLRGDRSPVWQLSGSRDRRGRQGGRFMDALRGSMRSSPTARYGPPETSAAAGAGSGAGGPSTSAAAAAGGSGSRAGAGGSGSNSIAGASRSQAPASSSFAALRPRARDLERNRDRNRWGAAANSGWWGRNAYRDEEDDDDLWEDRLMLFEAEELDLFGADMDDHPFVDLTALPAAPQPPPNFAPLPFVHQPAVAAVQAAQPAPVQAAGAVALQAAMLIAAPPGEVQAVAPPAPPVTEPAKVLQDMASKLPGLRELVLDGCDAVKTLRLAHASLKNLVVARCVHVKALALNCPSLTQLNLKECSNLASLGLTPVGLQHLSLGSVTNLVVVRVSAPQLGVLDLKGCANLVQVQLEGCSSLHTLDTQFCGALDGAALAAALSTRPPLQHLILSVNAQLGDAAIKALSGVSTLQSLDLSYTDVRDVRVLAASLQHLTRLVMVNCSQLLPDTLMQLLDPAPAASGSSSSQHACHLRSLDCSYCPLQPHHVHQLVNWGNNLESLQLNGVEGVDDSLWQAISGLSITPPADAVASTGSCGTTLHSSVAAVSTVMPSSAASDVSMEDVEASQLTLPGATVTTETMQLSAATQLTSAGTAAASADASAGSQMADASTASGMSLIPRAMSMSPSNKSSEALLSQVQLSARFRLQNLQVLSLVRCSNLKSLCLGLLPAQPLEVWASKQYNCYSHDAAAKVAQALQWLPCSTTGQALLPHLHTLRLGLGQLQVLALDLPSLSTLDVSSCKRLRALELRTPQLTNINAQGCSCLPASCLKACLPNLALLSRLDVQFAPRLAGISAPATLS